MDPLSFNSPGFAPSAPTIEKGAGKVAHVMARQPQAFGAPLSGVGQMAAAVGDVNGLLRPKPTSTDRGIQRLQKVGSLQNKLFALDFANFGAAGILGGLAGMLGLPRVRAGVRTLFSVPVETLRKTKLGNLRLFRANAMEQVAFHSHEAGGQAATNWVPRAQKLGSKWKQQDAQLAEKLAEKIEPTASRLTSPVKSRFDQALTSVADTKVGRRLNDWATRFSTGRAAKAAEGYSSAIEAAKKELNSPQVGMFKKAQNFVTRSKAEIPVGTTEAITEVTEHLKNAAAATGGEAIQHTKAASRALETAFFSTQDKALKSHLGELGHHLENTITMAEKSHIWQGAKTKGISGLAEYVRTIPGRTSVFGALMVGAVLASVGAAVLITKKESKAAKMTYNELVADIGNAHHPMMENIKKAHTHQKFGSAAGLAISMVSEAANGALVASPASGGWKVAVGAMAVPSLRPLLVHDNVVLDAYAKLNTPLSHEEKVKSLCLFIGNTLPSVTDGAGIYSKRLRPFAEAVAALGLNRRDTMQFLADDNRVTALLEQVAAKDGLPKPALAAIATDNTVAPMASKAEAAYHTIQKPGILTLADHTHEGIVAGQQRIVGM